MEEHLKPNNVDSLLSVVIPTLNEEKNIAACIESVFKSNYDISKIEVIVVDTGSIDRTVKIANKFTSNVFCLHPIIPSASFGLAYGIKKCTGEYIQYLAADSLLDKNWFKQALLAFDDKTAVVGGSTIEVKPFTSIFSYIFSLGLEAGNLQQGRVLFNAGTGLIKKNVAIQIGNFNPSLLSEDEIDFGIKVNNNGYLYKKIRSPMIYHKLDLKNNFASFMYMIKRYARQGAGLRQLKELYDGTVVLKEYHSNLRAYKFAGIAPLLVLLLFCFAIYNLRIGFVSLVASVFLFFIINTKLSKKYSLSLKKTMLLSSWYLLTSWSIWVGYFFIKKHATTS